MKKLIIAAAITLAAVASQAASVNWGVNNIQSSPKTTVGAGWLVELYNASTAYSYADAKAGSISAISTALSAASGTMFRANGSATGYSGGDAVSVYAVIYDAATVADAKYYIVSDSISKTISAAGSDLNISFGNMASTATTNMFRNSTWTAVPEPTSGLLMLLGMAGLALRRRRA